MDAGHFIFNVQSLRTHVHVIMDRRYVPLFLLRGANDGCNRLKRSVSHFTHWDLGSFDLDIGRVEDSRF